MNNKRKISKKTCLAVLLCFIMGISLPAYAGGDVESGLRGGWHYSNLFNDGNTLYDHPMNSFYIGFFSNKTFEKAEMLQLSSGLTYYQVGSEQNDNNRIKLHYLNLPVSLKVKLGPVYGFGGLNGALKLGGETYFLGIKDDVQDISTFDAGVFAGIGIKILMVGVEAKYDWGLVDISNGYHTQYLQVGFVVYL